MVSDVQAKEAAVGVEKPPAAGSWRNLSAKDLGRSISDPLRVTLGAELMKTTLT